MRLTALLALCLAAGACGPAAVHRSTNPYAGLPLDVRPRPVGPGPAYRPEAISTPVARRATVDGMRCHRAPGRRFGIHLELFAHRLVIHIPAGIGVAPPQHTRGVYVLTGACYYPLRSLEPTGVFQITPGQVRTLGNLFAIWGQQLGENRLLTFLGPVAGFLNGHRWHRPLAQIPLHRHAEIVLEVDGLLPPHPSYNFAPGL